MIELPALAAGQHVVSVNVLTHTTRGDWILFVSFMYCRFVAYRSVVNRLKALTSPANLWSLLGEPPTFVSDSPCLNSSFLISDDLGNMGDTDGDGRPVDCTIGVVAEIEAMGVTKLVSVSSATITLESDSSI